MSDIVLIASRKDTNAMRRVYDDLEEADFTVWVDEDLEQGSPEWEQSMRHAIKNTECIVVLLSPNAAESQWVEEAISYARLNRQMIFVALLEGELRRSTPLGLRVEQYADLRHDYDSEMEDFVQSINAFIEGWDQADEEEDDYDDDEYDEEDDFDDGIDWDDWSDEDDDWDGGESSFAREDEDVDVGRFASIDGEEEF